MPSRQARYSRWARSSTEQLVTVAHARVASDLTSVWPANGGRGKMNVRNGENVSFRAKSEGALGWRQNRGYSSSGNLADPFAINPIRRSSTLVAGCGATISLPWLFSEQVATTIMLSVGWLAMTGLVIGLPVLLLSLIEEGVRLVRRRIRPTVDLLDLTPRLLHILVRHGYDAIDDIDRAPDAALLLLSNMDNRGVQAIRRSIAIWKYQRWQEQGFPVTSHD